MDAVGLVQAVDDRNARMIEGCEQLRLAPESSEPLRVFEGLLGQELEGYRAVENGVLRSPDDAHSALADRFDQSVMKNPLIRRKMHVNLFPEF